MEDQFDLPVFYKGEQFSFPARLLLLGYTHKFEVEVNLNKILFEPDEERNYRAIIAPSIINQNKNLDINLLQAIAEAIQFIVKG